jgi:outer membrane protein assembly factor BamB
MNKSVLRALLLLALASLFLAACGSVAAVNWPGMTVADGAVFVSQSQLKRIDATNGGETWVYPEKPGANDIFFAAPAVVDGHVFAGNYNNQVFALDATNRAEVWAFKDVEGKGRFIAGPVVAGGLVLVPSSDHNLYALDVKTGKKVWSFHARGTLWATVAVDDTNAYLAGMDHYLYAVDLKSGRMRWEMDLGGPMLHAPVLSADGMLYISTLSQEMLAVDVAKQKVAWREVVEGKVWSTPLLHESTLYFGTDKNKIYSMDAKTGAAIWAQDVTGAAIAAPTWLNGSVVFPLETGEIVSVSPEGKRGWTQTLKGKLNSTPVVSSDLMVVGGLEMEHLLVALDTQGRQAWAYDAPKK